MVTWQTGEAAGATAENAVGFACDSLRGKTAAETPILRHLHKYLMQSLRISSPLLQGPPEHGCCELLKLP